MWLLIIIPIVVVVVLGYLMIAMPGKSFRGTLPPLTPAEVESVPRLTATVRTLAVEIGERNLPTYKSLLKTEKHLSSLLQDAGYVVERRTYEVHSMEVANLEAELRGSSKPEQVIVLGAHYDTVPGCAGADDNSSAVAALIELARLMRTFKPARTIRFVCFVNEEPPYFQTESMGSHVYARELAERGTKVVAMLSLETMAYYDSKPGSQHYPFPFSLFYPDTGDFIAFVGNLGSRSLVRRVVGSFRADTRFPAEGVAASSVIPGIGWSDHWSFWQFGYPALMVTDTAPFRNPNYHAHSDTIETLDFEKLSRVTHGLVKVVQHLDRANL